MNELTLYLVRHGDAVSENFDPERPLSGTGLRDVKKIADYASKFALKVDAIYHSSKLRAVQTAQILSEALKPAEGMSFARGLNPLDDPGIWAEKLKDRTGSIMLVGHLPHLDKLASLLLSERKESAFISFKSSAMAWLFRQEAELPEGMAVRSGGMWMLESLLSPAMILS